MSVIICIAYLAHRSTLVASSPIPFEFPQALSLLSNDTSLTSPTDFGQRSTWDIVWGCLATIFACSWVSVHPNIPPPDARWWRIAAVRLELMVWTILAPEVVILLAAKQWIAARKLKKTYQERGWTITHGFFLQMGGFMLFDGKTRKGVLSPKTFDILLRRNQIAFPETTLEEIEDRSKGDGLSKGLVLVQTAWFIVQFAVRLAAGLAITPLELATFGFAALNGFMYFFWWNKPLDVRLGVPVSLVRPTGPARSSGLVPVNFNGFERKYLPVYADMPTEKLSIAIESRGRWDSWKLVILKSWRARFFIVARRNDYDLVDTMNVPIFFFSYVDRPSIVHGNMIAAVLGMVFGAIHCAGWNLLFPSLAEGRIWRIASFIIVGYPTMFLLISLPQVMFPRFMTAPPGKTPRLQVVLESILLWGVFLPIYIMARLFILVEAFLALRDLPTSATYAVQWTTVLPHV